MALRRFQLLLGIGLAATFAANSAFGQGFGGGGFGGGGFGGGGFGGGPGSGFSDYLQRKDENQNGVLDPEEWQNSRSRYMIESAAKEAGIDLSRPIPIQQLQAAMTAQREKMGGGFGPPGGGFGPPGGGWGRPPESSSSSSSSGSSSSGSSDSRKSESRSDKKSSLPPGVPGFGEKIDLKPVLGFGSALDGTQLASAVPLTKEEERAKEKERERERDRERERERKEGRDQPREERRDDKSSYGGGGSSNSGSSSRDREDYERREREKNRETAKSLVAQNDTNKDGHLSKRDDEWKGLRGTPENADYNKDGLITVDELTERLMERSRESYSSSSSSRGGYGSKPPVGTNGKPVRFLTATERLPEGLPSWFTRGDLNGDGQVSMGEYATKWDDAKISEFMKYDMNSDGMITAPECIAVEKSRGGSSSSRTASTFGAPPAGDKAAPMGPPGTKPVEEAKPMEKPSE